MFFNSWLEHRDSIEVLKLGCNILWCIWKARNKVVFEAKMDIFIKVIEAANNLYKEHNFLLDGFDHRFTVDPPPASLVSVWHSPPRGVIKINVDGATDNSFIAAGVIARDFTGKVLACSSIFINFWVGPDKIIFAEASAFLQGIEMAISLKVDKVIIEGDSYSMVAFLNDDRLKYPWRIRGILADCKKFLHLFSSISFSHVRREGNMAAHYIA
ncbi:hypothetical protein BVC80_2859g1 [Macleaya cordata]|uniref:RNase H type-1 domain-containing protein n=1 Tax=Macleaya cordata TaxID=56857 RepID=A0A200QRB5_MACCD|nr:hypothetical protein BVC80_2859g1 [Macleaya cordata]